MHKHLIEAAARYQPTPATGLWAALLLVAQTAAAGTEGGAEPAAAAAATVSAAVSSLEALSQAEVPTAAQSARRISDAPSATSVMTSEDIRRYGFRTLGQILDHMRGVYMTYSPNYVFFGARAYGGSEVFAGRVLLLIDGVTAADGIYDQIYLGEDSLVDPALIDRIEYAPGTGSAMYGRNAVVGVIHITTKQGRHLQGVQASAGLTQDGGRQGLVAAGWRHADGREWLASVSLGRSDGRPAPEVGAISEPGTGATWDRWLLKGRHGAWSAQWMAVERRTSKIQALGRFDNVEANQVLTLAHDAQLSRHWTVGLRFAMGDYRFTAHYLPTSEDEGSGDANGNGTRGRWRLAESLWTYDGIAGHRMVGVLEYRHDHRQTATQYSDTPGWAPSTSLTTQRRSVGASIEDELTLSTECRATVGVRADKREGYPSQVNPRGAVVCDFESGWSAKLSQGRATRFPSRSEEGFDGANLVKPQSINTTEAVLEGQQAALNWTASLYRYRLERLTFQEPSGERMNGRGLELELEWRHRGWHVRGSQAWQSLQDRDGQAAAYAPRTVSKLLVSAPLDGERLQLSATLRSLAQYKRSFGQQSPRRTQTDLLLLWRPLASNWDWSVGVRNLFNTRYRDIEDYLFDDPARLNDRQSRLWWASGSWSWR